MFWKENSSEDNELYNNLKALVSTYIAIPEQELNLIGCCVMGLVAG